MNYIESVQALCELLHDANLSDTEQAQPWQRGSDSNVLHNHLNKALRELAGEDFTEHYFESCEIDLDRLER